MQAEVSTYWVSLEAEVARPYLCPEVNLTVKEGSKQFRVCIQLAGVSLWLIEGYT